MDEQQQPDGRRRSAPSGTSSPQQPADGHHHPHQQSQKKKPRRCESQFPPLVLKAVAASHFLTTKELGRLLLLSSKQLTASAYSLHEEEVWKGLCANYWGVPDGPTLLKTLNPTLSAEQCSRKLAMDLPSACTEPRALQFAPKDYTVIVSVRELNKNQSIFCKAIPGQEIPGFCEKGVINVELDQFYSKWTVENAFDVHGDLVSDFTELVENLDLFTDLKLEYSVHILRQPDQKMIHMLKTTQTICTRYNGVLFLVDVPTDQNVLLEAWGDSDTLVDPPLLNATYAATLSHHCFGRHDSIRKIEIEPISVISCLKSNVGKGGKLTDGTLRIAGFKFMSCLTDDSGFDSSGIPLTKILKERMLLLRTFWKVWMNGLFSKYARLGYIQASLSQPKFL